MNDSYSPPADQLLSLGKAEMGLANWPDYLALGLTDEHVPELTRMLRDERFLSADWESPEVWGPVHAWRAIGQLRAEVAIEPLVRFLAEIGEEEDWAFDELPTVFAMIGRAAVPALTRFLADAEQGLWNRVAAIRAVEEIATADTTARDEVVASLTKQLEKWYRHDEVLNATLIDSLVELRAVEAAPLMQQAFEADQVDLFMRGDWEDVQVELGLLPERLTPRPRLHLAPFRGQEAEEPAGGGRATARKKTKRKMAKQSRKRNRHRR